MIKIEGCNRFQSWLYWGALAWGVALIIFMLADMALSSETKINVNTATKAELMWLKGIGTVKAKRIIELRTFTHIDSLRNVNGIGPKTMAKIRPFVTVSDTTHIHQEEECELQ